jgi:hypothetical protein
VVPKTLGGGTRVSSLRETRVLDWAPRQKWGHRKQEMAIFNYQGVRGYLGMRTNLGQQHASGRRAPLFKSLLPSSGCLIMIAIRAI